MKHFFVQKVKNKSKIFKIQRKTKAKKKKENKHNFRSQKSCVSVKGETTKSVVS